METKSITKENMLIRFTEALSHGQPATLYKAQAKTIRDLLLVAASLLFFCCTMYYAISSGKNVSSQTIEHKIQSQKNPKNSI